MRRLWRIGRVLDCFAACAGAGGCGCLCAREAEDEEYEEEEAAVERKALVTSSSQVVRLTDLVQGTSRTLGFHLEPKTVELRVSMHCYGCAKKVQKHISKMEGVTSYEVNLQRKKVVVTGDVTPLEVLQSVSKVKLAQLWMPTQLC